MNPKVGIIRDSKGRFIKGANLGHPVYGGFNTRFKKGHKILEGSEKGWFKEGNQIRFKNGIWSYRKFKKSKCEDCGSIKYLIVHHLNHNRTDNRLENLKTVCSKCHTTVYHPRKFGGNQYVQL